MASETARASLLLSNDARRSSDEPQRQSAAAVMKQVAHAAAVNGEGVLSYCRLLFCLGVLVRFLNINVALPQRAFVLNIATLVAGIVFSLWVLVRRHRQLPLGTALWLGGVADATIAFGSLLQTVLWSPVEQGYRGLLMRPDLTIVPVVVFAASFRLSPALAAQSGVLNGVAVVLLLVIDYRRLGEQLSYGWSDISLFVLVFVISAFGSVLMAARIRALLVTAALDSVRIESARWSMAQLLRQHHDTRTLLSAVNVNAELVREALRAAATGATGAAGADSRALAWADAIRADLAQVNASILELGEQTFAELASLGEPELVDTSAALPPLVSVLSQRFLSTTLSCKLASLPCVRIAGGPASLQRIVYNLLLNAVEGDGTSGAHRVWVSTGIDGDRFLLRVEDDGPGFPSAVLDAAPSGLSTKPAGTGLGLYGISRLVASSDGQLLLGQRDPKGASVTVSLPLATRVTASIA